MLNRNDMLELTRRMTPSRSSIDRIAGCYFDEEGYEDGSFNTNFLNLSASDKAKNLKIAKTIPFSETNEQLIEIDFPGETRESGDMMRLLDGLKEVRLKNDALLGTFYDVLAEKLPKGKPFAIFVFHGVYDIPIKNTANEEQWESEEIYDYLICTVSPVHGNYEVDEPKCGFLYPSFKGRSTDWDHIAVYEQVPGVSANELIEVLGCIRD